MGICGTFKYYDFNAVTYLCWGMLVPKVSSAQYGLIDIIVFISEIYSS
jgi:hypothetical protein